MPEIDPAESRRRVRSTALWAALAAAIMLFFGYRTEWPLPENSVPRAGTYLFVYTLKIGGWVMLAEALWLWTGRRAALVCDGVVTVLIGILLVLGGLLMTPGNWKAILFIVFGLLFIHSGLRSWRDARELSAASVGDAPAPLADAPDPAAPDQTARPDAAIDPGAEPPAPEGHLSQFADREQSKDDD